MWTYLAILFSFLLFVTVFVHRICVLKRGQANEGKDDVVEESVEPIKKETVSPSDKFKVEELCDMAEKKLKSGKEDEAIKYLVQALAIDALHLEAQHKLAILYMRKEMFGAAAALFSQLGDLTDEPVHYSHLGLALYQQNEFQESKEAYKKAILLDDARPQRYASLSQVYRAMGHLQNAVIALGRAIEIDGENLDYVLLLADLQTDLENYEEAEAILNTFLEVDPENEDAKQSLKTLKKLVAKKSEEKT